MQCGGKKSEKISSIVDQTKATPCNTTKTTLNAVTTAISHCTSPSYAIYKRDVLSKVALFNFVSNASGNSTLQVSITVPGSMPSTVTVK